MVFPTHFAEGEQEASAAGGPSTALPAKIRDARVAGEPALQRDFGDLPDPVPLQLREYWRLGFEHTSGGVQLKGISRVVFAAPVVTPRRIGRYALELWIGRELIDRVRFDFPLLAGEPPPTAEIRPVGEPVRFAPGAHVSQEVLLPNSDRATRLVLVDRATRTRRELSWPPTPSTESEAPATSFPASNAGR